MLSVISIKKSPTKCGAVTKHKTLICCRQLILSGVNILAFFSVVASSQISPHSKLSNQLVLSGCKDSQKIVYTSMERILHDKNMSISLKCHIFAGQLSD